MTATITVLGGSAAGGNTGMGCSGYLIEASDSRFVLDFGPGVLAELRRHTDFRTLDAIVISHVHLDHTLDLGLLRYAFTYNPVPPDDPVTLWMPPGGRQFLGRFAAAFSTEGKVDDFFSLPFDIGEYDPAGAISIGNTQITFTPTVHYIPCWAMRIAIPGHGDIFYTADTGPAARLEVAATGSVLVIAEAATITPEREPLETRGHLTAAEAGRLAAEAGAETLLLTHMWEEHGFERQRQRAAITFAGRIEIATPGFTLEIPQEAEEAR